MQRLETRHLRQPPVRGRAASGDTGPWQPPSRAVAAGLLQLGVVTAWGLLQPLELQTAAGCTLALRSRSVLRPGPWNGSYATQNAGRSKLRSVFQVAPARCGTQLWFEHKILWSTWPHFVQFRWLSLGGRFAHERASSRDFH